MPMDPEEIRIQSLLMLAIGMSGDINGAVSAVEHRERGFLNQSRNRLRMPRRMDSQTRCLLEGLGFIFWPKPGETPAATKLKMVLDAFPKDERDPLADDDVLQTVDAPQGWGFKPTGDNGYWSNLVDPEGRVRGSMFYKGAFYDRNASFSLSRRYTISSEYNEDTMRVAREERGDMPYVRYRVKDANGDILWTGEWLTKEETDRLEKHTDDWKEYLYKDERDQAFGMAWLRANYPEHDNLMAYW